jgi:predicted tellurium resistance membrane protein TerC
VLKLLATSLTSFLHAMNLSRYSLFLFLCALATTLTGCDAIGSIFKAGAYSAIIVVFLIVALLWFIIRKMRGPRI